MTCYYEACKAKHWEKWNAKAIEIHCRNNLRLYIFMPFSGYDLTPIHKLFAHSNALIECIKALKIQGQKAGLTIPKLDVDCKINTHQLLHNEKIKALFHDEQLIKKHLKQPAELVDFHQHVCLKLVDEGGVSF